MLLVEEVPMKIPMYQVPSKIQFKAGAFKDISSKCHNVYTNEKCANFDNILFVTKCCNCSNKVYLVHL